MKVVEVLEFGDSTVLHLTDADDPVPRSNQVRIDVHAAGINFGDIMQRRGTYRGGPEPPFVPGLEVAGVVDVAGEDTNYSGGDRVTALLNEGGYAEYAVSHESVTFSIPDEMTFEEAAGFPVAYLTAHNCLHDRGDVSENDNVLIHAAAGSVGSAAVQLAHAAGATVFGTASTAEKLALATDLGCDHPINYADEDFVRSIEQTSEHGIDVALDGVGNDVTERTLEVLAPFARIVTYGIASGEPGRLPTNDLLFNNTEVYGYHLEQTLQQRPERTLPAVSELTEMLVRQELEVQVGRRFPLAEAAEAHDFIEARQSMGKVVLCP